MVDGIPGELRERPQWVGFRLIPREGRWAKVPYDVVRKRMARTNDPRTWSPFDAALACYRAGAVDGIGFVFSGDDPYVGVDLDGCRDPDTGRISAWAATVLAELDSYAEVSPSGTGVKVIVRGSLPCVGTGGRRRLDGVVSPSGKPAEVELYHWGRFFALTGKRVEDAPATVEPRGAVIAGLWERFFSATRHCGVDPQTLHTPPSEVTSLADSELLDRARTAPNGDRFRRLFDTGSLDAYGGDHSRADLALCGLLAFWTHGDAARIDQLFRTSALMRDKWDERHAADGTTYGQMTIARAIGSRCG